MPIIGQLVASGPKTFNLDYCPQFLFVDDIGAQSLSAMQVNVRGKPIISLTDTQRINAYAQLAMQTSGSATIGHRILLADGHMAGQQTNILLTNSFTETPDVFGFADRKGSKVMTAGESTLNSNDNRMYSGFKYLAFIGTNVDYVTINYRNGYSENMEVKEIDLLYANLYDSTNGKLQGMSIICAEEYGVASARVQTNSGGQVTIMRVGVGKFVQ